MELSNSPVPASSEASICDEDDPRNVLESAVKSWIQRGEQIPLRDVPYSICYLISTYFVPQHETWKLLASELYVERKPTHSDLLKIEGDAYVLRLWPSQVLLLNCCSTQSKSYSLSDLLTVLHTKLKRLDCLQELYDENLVSEFLDFWESQLSKCPLSPPKNIAEDTLSGQINKLALNSADENFKFQKIFKKQLDLNGLLVKPTMREVLELVNACIISNHAKIIKNRCDESKQTLSVKTYQCVNSPRKLVILLTYSADLNNTIQELVQKFWIAEFGVIAEYSLRGKGYFETNPRDSWEKFFKQCDFVVPVISPQYLQDIQRPSHDDQSIWVRFVYDLYTRKYVTDGCLNNVVRPLLSDGVPIKSLTKVNPTLAMRWQFEEIDSFIKMLKTNYRSRYRA